MEVPTKAPKRSFRRVGTVTGKAFGAVSKLSIGTTRGIVAAVKSTGASLSGRTVDDGRPGGNAYGDDDGEDDGERDSRVMELFRALSLQGGSPHSHLVVAVAKGKLAGDWRDESTGLPIVTFSWFRVGGVVPGESGNGRGGESFDPLPTVDGQPTYQPSADDIGCRISVQCADSRNQAVCRFAELGPLPPDALLVEQVEAALTSHRLLLPRVQMRLAPKRLRRLRNSSSSPTALNEFTVLPPPNGGPNGAGAQAGPDAAGGGEEGFKDTHLDSGETPVLFGLGEGGEVKTGHPGERHEEGEGDLDGGEDNSPSPPEQRLLSLHEVSLELTSTELRVMACESDTPRGLAFDLAALRTRHRNKQAVAHPSQGGGTERADDFGGGGGGGSLLPGYNDDGDDDGASAGTSGAAETTSDPAIKPTAAAVAFQPAFRVVLFPAEPCRVDLVLQASKPSQAAAGGAGAGGALPNSEGAEQPGGFGLSWFGEGGGELWGYLDLEREAVSASQGTGGLQVLSALGGEGGDSSGATTGGATSPSSLGGGGGGGGGAAEVGKDHHEHHPSSLGSGGGSLVELTLRLEVSDSAARDLLAVVGRAFASGRWCFEEEGVDDKGEDDQDESFGPGAGLAGWELPWRAPSNALLPKKAKGPLTSPDDANAAFSNIVASGELNAQTDDTLTAAAPLSTVAVVAAAATAPVYKAPVGELQALQAEQAAAACAAALASSLRVEIHELNGELKRAVKQVQEQRLELLTSSAQLLKAQEERAASAKRASTLSAHLAAAKAELEATQGKAYEAEERLQAKAADAEEKRVEAVAGLAEANVAVAKVEAELGQELVALKEEKVNVELAVAEEQRRVALEKVEVERLEAELNHWKRKTTSLKKEVEKGLRDAATLKVQGKELLEANLANELLESGIEVAKVEANAFKQALEHALTVTELPPPPKPATSMTAMTSMMASAYKARSLSSTATTTITAATVPPPAVVSPIIVSSSLAPSSASSSSSSSSSSSLSKETEIGSSPPASMPRRTSVGNNTQTPKRSSSVKSLMPKKEIAEEDPSSFGKYDNA